MRSVVIPSGRVFCLLLFILSACVRWPNSRCFERRHSGTEECLPFGSGCIESAQNYLSGRRLHWRVDSIESNGALRPTTLQRSVASDHFPRSGTPRTAKATMRRGQTQASGHLKTWGKQQSRQSDQSNGLCDQIWAVLDLVLLLDQPTITLLRPGKKKLCTFSLWAHNSSSIAVVYFRLRVFIYCAVPLDVLHSAVKKKTEELAQVVLHLDDLNCVEGRAFIRHLRSIFSHAAY